MLKVANNKLIIGKEEYYPFSAEMHYVRVNKRYWSICFERIRKAGFRIISTCVPWNLHEPMVGDFDFMGVTDHTKDLVVFLELAREFGFKVILHPGPFIDSDWRNGGYPDFLYGNPEILAKDSSGEPVKISTGEAGERAGRKEVFSPLHPRFLTHVKRYLSALSDIIKNYVYPKGPVIMVKLDNGLLPFQPGRSPDNLDPFNQDYNEYLINTLFPEYLKERYKEIKKLNQLYGERYRDFKDVNPPTELKISKPQNLVKYFDWIGFKESVSSQYILKLKELYHSFEVASLFSTDLFLSKDFSLPFNWQALESDDLFAGISLFELTDYVEMVRHLRYFATCGKFSWSSQFPVGSRADLPKDAEKYFPIPPRKVKFLLITSLASGIKGFNHYMFVERDHWYDAPLANDGTIRPSFDLIKKFNELSVKIELETLRPFPRVGLANYRPYLWFDYLSSRSQTKSSEHFPSLLFLLSKTHKGLSQDLINLKLDYGIPDLWSEESLKSFPVLLVPSAEFMDERTQQLLINLAKGGTNLILFGLLPRFDLKMKQCKLLSSSLRIQTKASPMVGKVKAFQRTFFTFIYGYIRGAKKSQVLAQYQDRPVGLMTKLGQGKVFLFTFDIAAQLSHDKLSFLEEVLGGAGVQSMIYCDAPEVDVVLQKNEKNTVLYLINPTPTSTFSEYLNSNLGDEDQRSLILRFEPTKLGIKGKKLRLVDILGDEVIRTSSEQLKAGIMIKIKPQDSRMYLIEAGR